MASNPNHHANFITVPTKQHDGGSECGSRATIIAAAAAVAPKPKVDAFTKYSSNLIRMKELLLLGHDSNEDDDEDLNYLAPLNDALRHASISISRQNNNNNNNGVDASKRRRGNDSRPIAQQGLLDVERKTRLSFELHPSLLLHDPCTKTSKSLPKSQMMSTKKTRQKSEEVFLRKAKDISAC